MKVELDSLSVGERFSGMRTSLNKDRDGKVQGVMSGCVWLKRKARRWGTGLNKKGWS